MSDRTKTIIMEVPLSWVEARDAGLTQSVESTKLMNASCSKALQERKSSYELWLDRLNLPWDGVFDRKGKALFCNEGTYEQDVLMISAPIMLKFIIEMLPKMPVTYYRTKAEKIIRDAIPKEVADDLLGPNSED